MKQEIRNEFESLLDKDKQARDSRDEATRKHQEAARNAAEAWADQVDRVLLPSLNDMKQLLTSRGWTCDITKVPAGFQISIYRGDMSVFQKRARPNLKFILRNGSTTVGIDEESPSMVGGDTVAHAVDEVTPEMVEKRVLEFLQKLMR